MWSILIKHDNKIKKFAVNYIFSKVFLEYVIQELCPFWQNITIQMYKLHSSSLTSLVKKCRVNPNASQSLKVCIHFLKYTIFVNYAKYKAFSLDRK